MMDLLSMEKLSCSGWYQGDNDDQEKILPIIVYPRISIKVGKAIILRRHEMRIHPCPFVGVDLEGFSALLSKLWGV
ncbi:MAG: hypothetical protein SVY53_12410 [Chloroflexota bacterium]|nr:hypothetical protein [Chloroflexota bacterium]